MDDDDDEKENWPVYPEKLLWNVMQAKEEGVIRYIVFRSRVGPPRELFFMQSWLESQKHGTLIVLESFSMKTKCFTAIFSVPLEA